jgi:ammonia channel protein AmtB
VNGREETIAKARIVHLNTSTGLPRYTAVFDTGKWSLDAATLGMLAGLVMITPAGGFVSLTDAFLLGIIGSVLIYQMLKFKSTKLAHFILWVDPADVFATHAFGGVVATLLTGFFGSREAAGFDGVTDIVGGALHDGNWYQLVIQVVEGLIGASWSFGASYAIIALIDCIPGLEVLCTDE